MKRRPWTPDQIVYVRGERNVQQSPKRGCTRCGLVLGDMTDSEIAAHGRGQRLRRTHDECPRCQGHHVLVATPAPVEPGAATSEVTTTRLLCPGTPAGEPVAPCAVWRPCGCRPPAGVEPLSVEWELFVAARCPGSPTLEHRHAVSWLSDAEPIVVAPVVGTCFAEEWWEQMGAGRPTCNDSPADFVSGPGVHPVDPTMLDDVTIVLRPLDAAGATAAGVAEAPTL